MLSLFLSSFILFITNNTYRWIQSFALFVCNHFQTGLVCTLYVFLAGQIKEILPKEDIYFFKAVSERSWGYVANRIKSGLSLSKVIENIVFKKCVMWLISKNLIGHNWLIVSYLSCRTNILSTLLESLRIFLSCLMEIFVDDWNVIIVSGFYCSFPSTLLKVSFCLPLVMRQSGWDCPALSALNFCSHPLELLSE